MRVISKHIFNKPQNHQLDLTAETMEQSNFEMVEQSGKKTVVVGAGPVGSLAALYAATRGDEVEVYELRGGMFSHSQSC